MKKKIIGVAVVAAIALVGGWNFNQSKNETKLNDLALANVEALAEDESDYDKKEWERYNREDGTGYNCTKGGSETC